MRFAVLAVCGFVSDALFGDPAWLPHPVCAVGALIYWLEKWLRQTLMSLLGAIMKFRLMWKSQSLS